MSKYKVGDKVVLTVTSTNEMGCYSFYMLNDNFNLWEQSIDNHAEPLTAYTEPLEAKIRRQAAEITRLLAENKELKDKLDNRCDMCIERHEKEVEQARAEGEQVAWELARKIVRQPINGGYKQSEFEEIFGCGYISDIFEKYTYSEAAAKVEAWEKAKEEIKVGDVLENMAFSKVKCVVTNLYPDNMAYSIFGDGTAGMHELNNFKKTGRHIDIDSFLKQIGGEQE